jgi:hypothetical protein
MIWLLVGALALLTVALKVIPASLVTRQPPARLQSVVDLLAPVLLSALVAISTLSSGHRLTLDARLWGLVAAAAALLIRPSPLLAAAAAATTAAMVRLAGLAP